MFLQFEQAQAKKLLDWDIHARLIHPPCTEYNTFKQMGSGQNIEELHKIYKHTKLKVFSSTT
jgi:hypothetical protein